MNDLSGKTAVVTGGASGIGLAMATRFATEGMNVVLADRDAAPLDAAAAALRATGAQVLAVVIDVSERAQIERLAAEAEAAFGAIHVLCNNAGVGGAGGPLWAMTENDWRWTLGVNLWGVLHGIGVFVPRMLAHGEPAHVVNTASIAGVLTPPFMGDYVTTKHAVVALSEVLARDLSAFGAAIKVSVLCPGFVQTQIHNSARHRPEALTNPAAANPAADAARAGLMNAVSQMVAAGKPASEIAGAVVDAIRSETFYIFTHDELWPAVEARYKDQRERRYPAFDPSQLTAKKL